MESGTCRCTEQLLGVGSGADHHLPAYPLCRHHYGVPFLQHHRRRKLFGRIQRWSSDDDSPLCHHFALRPAIQLATPALKLGKDKDMGLSFILSPGLTIPLSVNQRLNISYYPNVSGIWSSQRFDQVKNRGGRAIFYHIKGMFTLDLGEQYTLSAGYTFSDFDMYSGGRNMVVEGKKLTMPAFRFMHSFFVSLGYRF